TGGSLGVSFLSRYPHSCASAAIDIFLAQHHLSVSVQSNQDKQQQGKREQRSSSIANQRQRNTNYGSQPDGHRQIDADMKEIHGSNTIGITSAEHASLSFCHCYYSKQQ